MEAFVNWAEIWWMEGWWGCRVGEDWTTLLISVPGWTPETKQKHSIKHQSVEAEHCSVLLMTISSGLSGRRAWWLFFGVTPHYIMDIFNHPHWAAHPGSFYHFEEGWKSILTVRISKYFNTAIIWDIDQRSWRSKSKAWPDPRGWRGCRIFCPLLPDMRTALHLYQTLASSLSIAVIINLHPLTML